MRIRNRRGNTADNNALVLPEGHVVSDTEAHALRLHDNTTPGGFVITGDKVEIPNGPGPTELQVGDYQAGFYGEAAAGDLVDGESLASAVGLSEGSAIHSQSGWLKFASENKTLFVAKNPIRDSVSWEAIYQAGCVYGVDGPGPYPASNSVNQYTTVTFNGRDYIVRLLTGAGADPTEGDDVGQQTNDPDWGVGSEWNRLLYRIHVDNPPSQEGDNWAEYTDLDLMLSRYDTSGNYNWCQESSSQGTHQKVRRGRYGIDNSSDVESASRSSSFNGWRPVLELVV